MYVYVYVYFAKRIASRFAGPSALFVVVVAFVEPTLKTPKN